MDEDLILSKSELAALDLLIEAMAADKAAAALTDPAAFPGALFKAAKKVFAKVGKLALHATPHIQQALGGQALQDPRLQELSRDLSDMPELTLEQLLALRSLQGKQ